MIFSKPRIFLIARYLIHPVSCGCLKKKSFTKELLMFWGAGNFFCLTSKILRTILKNFGIRKFVKVRRTNDTTFQDHIEEVQNILSQIETLQFNCIKYFIDIPHSPERESSMRNTMRTPFRLGKYFLRAFSIHWKSMIHNNKRSKKRRKYNLPQLTLMRNVNYESASQQGFFSKFALKTIWK